MTAIEDHCNTIRSWLNYEEYSDELITSWTRMAEELLSTNLRCKHMIAIDTATVSQQRILLPLDWQEMDFVRLVDGQPLHFRPRDEFYDVPSHEPHYNHRYYTITGNYLIVGPPAEDQPIEISYYESIPPLGDDPNWLMKYYKRLYITATLSVGAAYSLEDERAVTWQASMQTFIDAINAEHLKSKTSGSILKMPRRMKGFG